MADKTDPVTIDVFGVLRALGVSSQPVLETLLQELSTVLGHSTPETPPSGTAETRRPSTAHEAQRPQTWQAAGIPYPFSELPPPDEPMTDLQMADTLETVLAQLAGLTQVLKLTRLDEIPHGQLRAVHELLAAHAKAAQTILRRWWDEKKEA